MIPPTVATAAFADSPMSFVDHLEELRRALLRAGLVALVLVGAAWGFSGRLLDALIAVLAPGQKVLALAPAEAFSARMNVALWTGGLLAVPYLMYEAWRFVAPALKRNERQFALPWMVASALLLYAGIAFALGLLLPTMVTMLSSFATHNIESRLSLTPLLSFAIQLAAGCGLLFQLPVVLCLLAWFGIVPPSRLAKAWRHAIFFIALGAALITPGDGPSMLILSAPLIVLYFLSVFVASILWKMRAKAREQAATTEEG
ncbi:MAG: twin-arginine translocase subunit TatC [Candidatus Eiseniibacteriota bacterium]